MNTDDRDAAPWAQWVTDARGYDAALRSEERQLLAVRWPASVQPYISAFAGALEGPTIRCNQAEIRAGSYASATTVSDANTDCLAAADSTLPDTVRRLLGLPTRN